MNIDLSIFTNYAPQLFLGFWMTIKIVIGAIILGLPFGLVLALARHFASSAEDVDTIVHIGLQGQTRAKERPVENNCWFDVKPCL